ncbi:MAG TPA: histidine phosphatase family protein [Acetobacteraceae bacterium]|jgi:probable phosphoglycerate mutase|nr:histidine phosphatase family protein [Acetobacteraceae bacterium]
MLTKRAFWFLRHGETDWNARNLSQGRVDIPLNPVGQAQAKTAAKLLRNRGICTIVASPLSRAHDTALAASEQVGVPVLLDPELQEVAFGAQEGQPMVHWFDDWVAERLTPDGAESFADLRARAVRAVNRALEHDPAVLVVAHGALFRALRSAMGLEPNVRTANGVPLFCEPGRNGTPWTLTPAT